jgi:hypothetical protein
MSILMLLMGAIVTSAGYSSWLSTCMMSVNRLEGCRMMALMLEWVIMMMIMIVNVSQVVMQSKGNFVQ